MSCLLRAGIGGEEEVTQDSTHEASNSAEHFGVYEIDRREDGSLYELGRGAMGVTYRATDTSLQRKVALKIIKIDIAERSADARERFMREARAAAALRHENIATIHQFGMRLETGQYFYAMELIEGETLEERVRRAGPLDARTTIKIAQQVTAALAAVEKRGLVHRDLKPANLMLVSPDGETTGADRNDEKVFVKIIDFGLAKALNAPVDPKSLTHDRFVGTPAFASPEQFEHSTLDVRSDIYSLGETLWFALTGKTPFVGQSVEEIHRAQKSNALPIEQLKAAQVPFQMRSLLESMLAFEPAARPGTHDLAAQLQRCAAQTSEKIRSIAVLPFADLSEERDQEYFSEGVAEEILNALSKVGGLDVPARTSCFAFRGATLDAREIGEHLGVETLLDGSIRKAGKRVRISVQLVDVSNGYQLWSERFDREIEDIFAIQDEIARSVLESLGLALTEREEFRFLKPSTTAANAQTDNIKAYHSYLRGRYQWNKRNEEGFRQAIVLFKEALDEDPAFPKAWAGLADCYALLGCWGFDPPHRSYPKAKAAAERAIALDDYAAEAHASLAVVRKDYEWDWAGAGHEYRRALELNPSYALGRQWYGEYLACVGKHAEAIKELEQACALDPLSPMISATLGRHGYYFARDFERATKQLRDVTSSDPEFWVGHNFLGWVLGAMQKWAQAIEQFSIAHQLAQNAETLVGLGYAQALAGNADEARETLAKLEMLRRHSYVQPVSLALVHVGLAEKDEAFVWLEKGYDEHAQWLSEIKTDPAFDPLRSDARFADFLKRIGLGSLEARQQ